MLLLKPCLHVCSPVYVTPDPIRGEDNVLVLCEVFSPDATPHETNTRAKLETIIDDKVRKEAPLYGFEQVITKLLAILCSIVHEASVCQKHWH